MLIFISHPPKCKGPALFLGQIVNILILGIHCLASYSCIRKNSDRFGRLYMAFLYHKER